MGHGLIHETPNTTMQPANGALGFVVPTVGSRRLRLIVKPLAG
jgi:hypothetical protein